MIDTQKLPSARLQTMLKEAGKQFETTAALVMACYQQAISEGFQAKDARKLLRDNLGLSDGTIRRYLPAEAKDMKHDGSKQQKEKRDADEDDSDDDSKNNVVITRMEQTIDELKAENAKLREQVRTLASGQFTAEIPAKFDAMVKNYIQRGHKFAFVIRDGAIVDVTVEA